MSLPRRLIRFDPLAALCPWGIGGQRKARLALFFASRPKRNYSLLYTNYRSYGRMALNLVTLVALREPVKHSLAVRGASFYSSCASH